MTKNLPNFKNILAVIGGVGAGLGIMYLLDPQKGSERRAAIRDKAVGLSNDVRQSVYTTGTDLKARAQEVIHDETALMPKMRSAPVPEPLRITEPENTKAGFRNAH